MIILIVNLKVYQETRHKLRILNDTLAQQSLDTGACLWG